MRTWYTITASADNSVARLSIHDEIGMWGVSARDFIRDLKARTEPNIEVSINSPGGSLFDAVAIFNALRTSGKNITTQVAAIAASAASYILQAGDKRTAPSNAFVMVHNPIMGVYGNAEEMADALDILTKVGESMRATYQARSGMSDEQMTEVFAGEGTYLTAQEALDLGLLDEVTPAVAVTASYDVERLPEHIQAMFKPKQPPAPPVVPFADQLRAALDAADLSAYASDFALAHTDMAGVQAAVTNAREVRALCAVLAEDAVDFIRAGKSLTDVRAALLAKRVEAQEVNTSPVTPGGAPAQAQPSATTSSIWAAHTNRK